jgi:ornithine carbamoyltransferase
MDGPRSVIWQQAANRLPAQKALLEWLLTLDGAEAAGRDGRRVR